MNIEIKLITHEQRGIWKSMNKKKMQSTLNKIIENEMHIGMRKNIEIQRKGHKSGVPVAILN